MLVVVMGVSGSGKTTIGRRVADRLELPFVEGDDFHDPEHLDRMRRGIPLTDDEREPWLDRLRHELARHAGTGVVVACSALTERSRSRLLDGLSGVYVLFLHGDEDLLRRRLEDRGSGVGPDLLASQLDTLEPPDPDAPGVITVDVGQPLDATVDQAVGALTSFWRN